MIAAERLPVEVACRVLGVSSAGYYDARSRPPSARSIRHAWLTDLAREIHADSYGAYGALRVHAELVLGRGITVGHNSVALVMRRAGIVGRLGAPRRFRTPGAATASDLVDRRFPRSAPNELWVTDITEHPTREGKVYCADGWTSTAVAWSPGRSTVPRPRCSRPARSGWRSRIATRPAARR